MSSYFSPVAYFPTVLQELLKPWIYEHLFHRFEADQYIANVSTPVLMLHGNEDWTIPPHHTTELVKARDSVTNACVEEGYDDKGLACSDVLFLEGVGHHNVMESELAQSKVRSFVNAAWDSASKTKKP